MKSQIKTDPEIEAMRHGGAVLAKVLDFACKQAAPGMATKELADKMAVELKAHGVQAAFKGFNGFPDVVCISVNDEVVHGIPSKKKLKEGDIVSIDLGVLYKGLITDSATTIYLGDLKSASPEKRRLLQATEEALHVGLQAIHGEGTPVGTISAAVQSVLDRAKLGIVKDLVGHGVGHGMHEDPNIPNYGIKGSGPRLEAGMTIAVEPMATLGDWRVDILPDQWTVVSRDHSIAAHFEHTVLITDDGFEILTQA